MPTYAYRCTECEHAFDIHQSFSDASLTVCPECGGKLRKVFNSIGVTFNGSGFYRNDARADAKPKSSGSGTGSGSSESGSSSAKETSGSSSSGDSSGSSKPAATTSSSTTSS